MGQFGDRKNCNVVVMELHCWGKNCSVVVMELHCREKNCSVVVMELHYWGKNCSVVVMELRFILRKYYSVVTPMPKTISPIYDPLH